MRIRHSLAALLGGALLLAACGGTEPPEKAPAYTSEPPVRLAVNVIEVEDRSPPLPQANFIDERRSKELADRATKFLESQLVATGGSGSARATILQASVLERLIPGRSGGLGALVTGEPTYSLDAHLRVRVAVLDASGADKSWTEAGVDLTRTLGAGTSVLSRDSAARQLEADLVAQLDKTLRQSIADNLSAYVAP